MNHIENGDLIANIPDDNSIPSHNELQLIDKLFHKHKTILDTILLETKDILFIGILFILFSIQPVENLIKKFIHSSNTSIYILLGVKSILFMLTYFFIKNIYLVRTS